MGTSDVAFPTAPAINCELCLQIKDFSHPVSRTPYRMAITWNGYTFEGGRGYPTWSGANRDPPWSSIAFFWARMGRSVTALVTGQRPPQGCGCNDASIPRDPAGRPPEPRPRCISLHIRPVGIRSRFADRRLFIFVIEGALPHTRPS